jgi:hypothetical protein
MGTKLRTVSVRLGDAAGGRVSKAAQLARQSKGAFLARAGEAEAERILLDWAIERYSTGEASLSELAAETGLPLEVIATRIAERRGEAATDMYLASARRLAEVNGDPGFYAEARRAAKAVAAEDRAAAGRPRSRTKIAK